MTKTKLAKLAAKAQENDNIGGDMMQQPLPDDFDPVAMLDEHLGNHSTGHFSLSHFGQVPQQQPPTLRATTEQNVLAFESGADNFGVLATSLQQFNDTHPQVQNAHAPVTAITAQPTADGHFFEKDTQQALPGVGCYGTNANDATPAPSSQIAYSDAEMPIDPMVTAMDAWYNQQAARPMPSLPLDHNAEVNRTDRLELDFNNFVDCEAYENSPDVTYAGPITPATAYPPAAEPDMADFTVDLSGGDLGFDFSQNFELEFDGDAFNS